MLDAAKEKKRRAATAVQVPELPVSSAGENINTPASTKSIKVETFEGEISQDEGSLA